MIPTLVVTEKDAEVLVRLFKSSAGTEAMAFFQGMAESISFHEDPYITAFCEGRRQLAVFLANAAGISKRALSDNAHLDTNDSDNTGEII